MIPDNMAVFIKAGEEKLAYMCDAKKNSMRKTGAKWAGGSVRKHIAGTNPPKYTVEEVVVDPLELVNEPLEGFKIIASVSRYRTDNKLWRVRDPRGFVLEITTGNLEGIIADCNIVGGVISGKCVWGRYGSVTLLPINSELYKEERAKTDVQQTASIKAKDLIIGAKYKMKNGDEAVYFGKSHRVSFERKSYIYEPKIPKAKSHFYEVGSSLNVSTSTFQAIERIGNNIDTATLDAVLRRNNYVAGYEPTFLLDSATADYSIGLRESTIAKQLGAMRERYEHEDAKAMAQKCYSGSNFGTYFIAKCENKTQMWCAYRETKRSYIGGTNKTTGIEYRIINYNNRATISNFQDLQRGTAKNVEIEMAHHNYAYSYNRRNPEVVSEGVAYVPTITINGRTLDLLRTV